MTRSRHTPSPASLGGEVTRPRKRGPSPLITRPRYVAVRPGVVHKTRVLVEAEVLADFDKNGNLLGVEVLNAKGS